MSTKEPRGESLLAARLARAYPSLSTYSAATLAEELCRIERAQRRHAERCCSGEDGGYVKRWFETAADGGALTVVRHDPDKERKAGERIDRAVARWSTRVHDLSGASRTGYGHRIKLQGDPRGPVLLLQLPGEGEAVAV